MVRVFANGPEELGSFPGRVIPKTQKMVLDVSLLNTQVRIMGKVEQSRERISAPLQHLGVVAIEKETFGSPLTTVTNFTNLLIWRKKSAIIHLSIMPSESLLLSAPS